MGNFIGFILAVYLKDKSESEINEYFGLKNDITPEEKDLI